MSFHVDLDEVAHVIERIAATDQDLEALAADLDATSGRLRDAWAGLSADAHARAHAEFLRGLATMRAALREMRTAAATAHGNYSGAADANLAMWDEIR